MAWTTMHFAVGMGCAGTAAVLTCSVLRRGWRWLPGAMTLGGVWALVPDMPRIFREDFYWQPISSILGTHQLERNLHRWGDLFFFHRQLDAQPHEYALLGLALILMLYNAGIVLLMGIEHKHRNSMANRAWRAHRSSPARMARRRVRQRQHCPKGHDQPHAGPHLAATAYPNASDVIYRIRPDQPVRTGDPTRG